MSVTCQLSGLLNTRVVRFVKVLIYLKEGDQLETNRSVRGDPEDEIRGSKSITNRKAHQRRTGSAVTGSHISTLTKLLSRRLRSMFNSDNTLRIPSRSI